MATTLPPLSGAILVSNPHRGQTMASALQNRRRKMRHNPDGAQASSKKRKKKAATSAVKKLEAQLKKARSAAKKAKKASKRLAAKCKIPKIRLIAKKGKRSVSVRAKLAKRRKAKRKSKAPLLLSGPVAASANPRRRKAKHNGRKVARRNVSALQNRSHRKARRNGAAWVAELKDVALPLVIGGAAGAALHFVADQQGLTAKVSEYAQKVPAVGEYLAKAPNTIQGALVWGLSEVLAPYVKKQNATAGKAVAYVGRAALLIGAGMDAKDLLASRSAASVGDLAFGDLAFGDLAFGDVSALGGVSALQNVSALGDGMAFRTAPLTAAGSADYGQASLGDAYYSGADLSAREGQMLINGRDHYLHAYGAPPIRAGQVANKQASHLAGREGHRWGWLVKLVGWDKARQIAALPPGQRIAMIRKLRAAALQAFQIERAQDEAMQQARELSDLQDSAAVSGSGASGAQGAAGAAASNGLGDLAFGDLAFGDLAFGDGALFASA